MWAVPLPGAGAAGTGDRGSLWAYRVRPRALSGLHRSEPGQQETVGTLSTSWGVTWLVIHRLNRFCVSPSIKREACDHGGDGSPFQRGGKEDPRHPSFCLLHPPAPRPCSHVTTRSLPWSPAPGSHTGTDPASCTPSTPLHVQDLHLHHSVLWGHLHVGCRPAPLCCEWQDGTPMTCLSAGCSPVVSSTTTLGIDGSTEAVTREGRRRPEFLASCGVPS